MLCVFLAYGLIVLFYSYFYSADSYQWNEYSKFEYSQRSFCTIPIWQNTVPFDICFQGSRHHGCDVDPIINKSIWEDVFIESFRRFAEDCDHLKHINVTSDCFNAFSGITSAYMDSLVDDMLSNSVGMVNLLQLPFSMHISFSLLSCIHIFNIIDNHLHNRRSNGVLPK